MPADDSLNDLYALRRVIAVRIDWAAVHELAIAEGHGFALSCDEERAAAVDELLAAGVAQLLELGELAAYTGFDPLVGEYRVPLARVCGGLVRLLDRALIVHGREHGYDVSIWRADVPMLADAAAALLKQARPEELPLPETLQRASRRLAEAFPALARDRIGVPGLLTEASAELLLVYAAAREP